MKYQPKNVLGVLAVFASLAATPALAQGTLRIGMTASDVPLTTGQTDQGGEGMRFMGYTVYDALINWDLSSADKASVPVSLSTFAVLRLTTSSNRAARSEVARGIWTVG